jgi:hypothetical protein
MVFPLHHATFQGWGKGKGREKIDERRDGAWREVKEMREEKKLEGRRHLGPEGRLAPILLPVLRRPEVHLGMAVERESTTACMLVRVWKQVILLVPQVLPFCVHDTRYPQSGGSKSLSLSHTHIALFLSWSELW